MNLADALRERFGSTPLVENRFPLPDGTECLYVEWPSSMEHDYHREWTTVIWDRQRGELR